MSQIKKVSLKEKRAWEKNNTLISNSQILPKMLIKPQISLVSTRIDMVPCNDLSANKFNHHNQNNVGVLDKKLPVAEASLQPLEDINAQTLEITDEIESSVGNIDKIRDILFGRQMREYEKRFQHLEKSFSQENVKVRKDILQRLKMLEGQVDSAINDLNETAKQEHQERQSALQNLEHEVKVLEEQVSGKIDNLSEAAKQEHQDNQSVLHNLERELKALKNELNNRFTQLDEKINQDIKKLRQQTLKKFQELTLQLRQQNDNLITTLNQEVVMLQEEKVNRSELADFFKEFAVHLMKNSSEIE